VKRKKNKEEKRNGKGGKKAFRWNGDGIASVFAWNRRNTSRRVGEADAHLLVSFRFVGRNEKRSGHREREGSGNSATDPGIPETGVRMRATHLTQPRESLERLPERGNKERSIARIEEDGTEGATATDNGRWNEKGETSSAVRNRPGRRELVT